VEPYCVTNQKETRMLTGEELRLLRLIKGLKQQFIASKMGISQQAYSKLEKKNSINASQAEKILHCMNCRQEDVDALDKIHTISNEDSS
jgi:transcriptional regulator with XRE-family HTH domain